MFYIIKLTRALIKSHHAKIKLESVKVCGTKDQKSWGFEISCIKQGGNEPQKSTLTNYA